MQIHEQDVILSMWGPDVPKVNPATALFHFTIYASLIGGIAYLAYALKPESPVVPREYPYDGLVKELGGLEVNKVNFDIMKGCVRLLNLFGPREIRIHWRRRKIEQLSRS